MGKNDNECSRQRGYLPVGDLAGHENREMAMNQTAVTMVRIYLTEGEQQLTTLLKRLRDWEKLRGVTVFRGISGFGDHGVIHGAKFVDLSLNLPIVVEFFDVPDKIDSICEHLNTIVKPGHLVKWTAYTNE